MKTEEGNKKTDVDPDHPHLTERNRNNYIFRRKKHLAYL